jgi:glycosyltransferase involved in cell wall biosynthesis
MPDPSHEANPEILISVVICTYNSRENLRETLESFCRIAAPPASAWELLLVDNNSTDDTQEVARSFQEAIPLRYCFEPKPGKCRALNHGIELARGSLVLITDHDVNVTSNWLESYLRAAREHPEASFFGGRVLPHWAGHPPRWIRENVHWLRINPHLDEGDREIFMEPGTPPYFLGANMAFRRAVFDAGIRFEEHLGPRPDAPATGGEDIDVERRLLAQGHRGLYVPDAIVHHRHPANRMTEAYLREYYEAEGITRARYENLPGPRWFGVPRYLWRELVQTAIAYGLLRCLGPARAWLKAEIRFALAAGTVKELLRLRKVPPRVAPAPGS